MLSTRNLRVVVSVLAIFGIVAFFATTSNSLGGSIQRVKPNEESTPFGENDVKEEAGNTLQGKPHKGTDPPYANHGSKGGAGADGKGGASKPVIADKTTNTQQNVKGDTKEGADAKKGAHKQAGGDDGWDTDKGSDDDVSIHDGEEAAQLAPPKGNSVAPDCNEESYVVMIDAGSTGSRVHVYKFGTCSAPPVLLDETFEMLKPGLSSFENDPSAAAKSLDPLLNKALEVVPAAKQACTPVSVKATAGLRLVGEAKSKAILDEVRSHLENDFPFAVVSGDGISLMDGKDEGVYAWITTNFLLGNIGSAEKTPTAAVFDLGGGSTQIVFEPELGPNEELHASTKHEFTYGDRKFSLYQYSHLGYGLMEGRNKINALVLESELNKNSKLKDSVITSKDEAKKAKATVNVKNPCVPPGVIATDVTVQWGEDQYYVVNFEGPSVAAGAQCRFLAERALNKDAECTVKPCSFNGIHQPSLTKTFRRSADMYVFSYFYDRTNPLGFPSSFTVEELSELAKVVCNGETLWKDVLLDDHVKALNEEPQWCLDLSFITAMLHTGYDIPFHRELRTANKIDGNELGWCLGASLPLLDQKSSGWKCKLKEAS